MSRRERRLREELDFCPERDRNPTISRRLDTGVCEAFCFDPRQSNAAEHFAVSQRRGPRQCRIPECLTKLLREIARHPACANHGCKGDNSGDRANEGGCFPRPGELRQDHGSSQADECQIMSKLCDSHGHHPQKMCRRTKYCQQRNGEKKNCGYQNGESHEFILCPGLRLWSRPAEGARTHVQFAFPSES